MNRYRTFLFIIVSILFSLGYFLVDNMDRTMENGDSSGYYMHLVSLFINKDVGNYDQTISDYLKYYPQAGNPKEDKFGIRKTEKGRYYIKYTLGVAAMELPAFLTAHFIATVNEKYTADGWSEVYKQLIHFSKVIYILLGIYLLIGILLKYYSKFSVALSILAITFGSNLFFQGTFLTMSHPFLFFDYCLLIFFTIKFYESPSKLKAFSIGATVGLITLTRVPELYSIAIPIFWGIHNRKTLNDRIQFFKKNYHYLLIALFSLLLVFSPQFLYWKYVSGDWIIYAYQGESFDFLKPRIHKAWFSYKNGWLVYSPIMILSLLGLFFVRKIKPGILLPTIAFIGIHCYIHYSWHSWSYYPGLGSRPMVETYPLLAFGLAAFISWFSRKKSLMILITTVILLFIGLNLFQTWQSKNGLIWTERGNDAFYWSMFLKTSSTKKAFTSFETAKFQPEPSKLKSIDTIYTEDFEKGNRNGIQSEIKYSGQYALYSNTEYPDCQIEIEIDEKNILKGDWIHLNIMAYRKSEEMVWDRDNFQKLIIELYDEQGRKRRGAATRIASHIGNEEHSIWHSGIVNYWGKADFYYQIPKIVRKGWSLKIKIRNPKNYPLFLDDLILIHYRPI